jgi:repressor LexA
MPHALFHIRIPLLGIIEAGWPSPAEEELTDTLRLDEWLIKNREATFMVRAPSNSLIGAGIITGDLVLIDRSRTARDGDIVLAEVDDRTVLRVFRKQGSNVYLEAANPKYPPISPQEILKVTAVVVAVIRKY